MGGAIFFSIFLVYRAKSDNIHAKQYFFVNFTASKMVFLWKNKAKKIDFSTTFSQTFRKFSAMGGRELLWGGGLDWGQHFMGVEVIWGDPIGQRYRISTWRPDVA